MHLIRHSILITTLGFGCTAAPIPVNLTSDAALSLDVSTQPNDASLMTDAQFVVDLAIPTDTAPVDEADVAVLDLSVDGGNFTDAASDEPDAAVVESDVGMDAGFELPTCRVAGPTPPEFCTGTAETQFHCDAFGGPSIEGPTTIGSEQPIWALQDEQPQSCGFEQHYGLDAFHGKPTMVVLLWAGCGFCQAQTEKLQQMHYELQAEGKDVHFVIINQSAENPPIEYLTARCNFPILQDESDINVWDLQGGRKDDFYFYDSNGILKNFIPRTDDIALTSYDDPPIEPTSGYTNIKNAVLDLIANDGEPPVTPEPSEP